MNRNRNLLKNCCWSNIKNAIHSICSVHFVVRQRFARGMGHLSSTVLRSIQCIWHTFSTSRIQAFDLPGFWIDFLHRQLVCRRDAWERWRRFLFGTECHQTHTICMYWRQSCSEFDGDARDTYSIGLIHAYTFTSMANSCISERYLLGGWVSRASLSDCNQIWINIADAYCNLNIFPWMLCAPF